MSLIPPQNGPASLLVTDTNGSVLQAFTPAGAQAAGYTPYGHHPQAPGAFSRCAFNGELSQALTGHYLLGNGYRTFSPELMRFFSPDDLSPFGEGGLNAYAYCLGDPVNNTDPTGHMPLRSILKSATRPASSVMPATHPARAGRDGNVRRLLSNDDAPGNLYAAGAGQVKKVRFTEPTDRYEPSTGQRTQDDSANFIGAKKPKQGPAGPKTAKTGITPDFAKHTKQMFRESAPAPNAARELSEMIGHRRTQMNASQRQLSKAINADAPRQTRIYLYFRSDKARGELSLLQRHMANVRLFRE